jgi:hypothetical protein
VITIGGDPKKCNNENPTKALKIINEAQINAVIGVLN